MEPISPCTNSVNTQPDPRYIRQINGRQFISYAGLLELATRMGLAQLEVEVLVHPTPDNDNTTVCIATASLATGMNAKDLGEASAATLDPRVAKFLYSMASTRAKARSLRNLCGVGMTCLEELGSFTDVIGEDNEPAAAGQNSSSVNHSAPTMPAPASGNSPNETSAFVNASATAQPSGKVRQFPSPANNSSPANTGNGNSVPATEAQLRAINSIAKRRKLSAIELANFCKAALNMGLENLSKRDASRLIDQLKHTA